MNRQEKKKFEKFLEEQLTGIGGWGNPETLKYLGRDKPTILDSIEFESKIIKQNCHTLIKLTKHDNANRAMLTSDDSLTLEEKNRLSEIILLDEPIIREYERFIIKSKKKINNCIQEIKDFTETKEKIDKAINTLSKIEKNVLLARLNSGKGFKDICKEFNYGKTQIFHIYKQALEKVYTYYTKNEQK